MALIIWKSKTATDLFACVLQQWHRKRTSPRVCRQKQKECHYFHWEAAEEEQAVGEWLKDPSLRINGISQAILLELG